MMLGIGIASIAMMGGTLTPAIGAPSKAILVANPSDVGAPGDVTSPGASCPYSAQVWVCTIHLSETATSNAPATWSASSSAQANFSPNHGTLNPGGSIAVTVSLGSCGGYYSLQFAGPHNTAVVTFSCG